MKEAILSIIAVLVVTVALTWAAEGNEFFLYQYFAPKQMKVEREVFEQSKSYRTGMIQELQDMQFQYEQADAAHKEALGALILHRAADCNCDMPDDLTEFVNKLKSERTKHAY